MVFLKHGIESMQKDDTYLTLYDFTKAVFHAASKIQLALAFAHRSEQLFRLGLIREAKSDAKAALPVSVMIQSMLLLDKFSNPLRKMFTTLD